MDNIGQFAVALKRFVVGRKEKSPRDQGENKSENSGADDSPDENDRITAMSDPLIYPIHDLRRLRKQ
jgi:hypothetical protein